MPFLMRFCADKLTGNGRGFGFVTFADSSGNYLLDNLHLLHQTGILRVHYLVSILVTSEFVLVDSCG